MIFKNLLSPFCIQVGGILAKVLMGRLLLVPEIQAELEARAVEARHAAASFVAEVLLTSRVIPWYSVK